MVLLFMLLWIAFNGRITTEILLIGLALSAVLMFFLYKFSALTLKKEIWALRKVGLMLKYVGNLLLEIWRSNWAVIRLVLSTKYEIEPTLVHFTCDLKKSYSRVTLADSITLTPGTITVSLRKNEFIIHCLDKNMAQGLDDSIFIRQLKRIEEDAAAK